MSSPSHILRKLKGAKDKGIPLHLHHLRDHIIKSSLAKDIVSWISDHVEQPSESSQTRLTAFVHEA